MKFLHYCSYGDESQVQVQGQIEGIECRIHPDVLDSRMPTLFLSPWQYDPGWAEMLMIGHLAFLRTYFDLVVPQSAITILLTECAKFEVVQIPEGKVK